ncbi:hypothetical protein COLO4_15684 [Corchorus olitorius]|uniref:Uncharacterized protein n=1 Tax=Corchorus olitorius TaxID=93759 RepID=A0A1R3JLN0_9ROSI|nr:hypothetical protein COLO4_15684 [Corchorus olitorius]
MAQKRATSVDGAKHIDSCSKKKQKSHDSSNGLSSKLIELDVLVNAPPLQLGSELILDSLVNSTTCNPNGSSWGPPNSHPAPKHHALTMPILKNSILINQVEKRHEVVENPVVISNDMNSTPSDENDTNISTVEAVRLNLPTGWDGFSLIRKCNFL